jgi:hypothetical protein
MQGKELYFNKYPNTEKIDDSDKEQLKYTFVTGNNSSFITYQLLNAGS